MKKNWKRFGQLWFAKNKLINKNKVKNPLFHGHKHWSRWSKITVSVEHILNEGKVKFLQIIQGTVRQTCCQNHKKEIV